MKNHARNGLWLDFTLTLKEPFTAGRLNLIKPWVEDELNGAFVSFFNLCLNDLHEDTHIFVEYHIQTKERAYRPISSIHLFKLSAYGAHTDKFYNLLDKSIRHYRYETITHLKIKYRIMKLDSNELVTIFTVDFFIIFLFAFVPIRCRTS